MPVSPNTRTQLKHALTLPADQQARAQETRELARELRKFKYMANHSFVNAGKLLLDIKTGKRYTDLGYKSMNEFLADPEYGMSKSTAYLYMGIYEYFVGKLGLSDNDIIDIDLTRLRALLPVLKGGGDVNEWLNKARVLGKGDFFSEIDAACGRTALDILPAMPEEGEETILQTTYVQIVRGSACCVCDKRPVDAHHFPRTRGAAATEDHVIPLCRECHIAYHNAPKDFFWQNKDRIINWFYSLIDILIQEAQSAESAVSDIPVSEV